MRAVVCHEGWIDEIPCIDLQKMTINYFGKGLEGRQVTIPGDLVIDLAPRLWSGG